MCTVVTIRIFFTQKHFNISILSISTLSNFAGRLRILFRSESDPYAARIKWQQLRSSRPETQKTDSGACAERPIDFLADSREKSS